MFPSLLSGDIIAVSKLSLGLRVPGPGDVIWQWGQLDRGDMVVVSVMQDEPYTLLRRVVGLPGEKIQIKNGLVQIQRIGENKFGNLPCEPIPSKVGYCTEIYETGEAIVHIHDAKHSLSKMDRAITLLEGDYFVLADDRRDGPDSRRFGVVRSKNIIGKAVFLLSPTKSQKNNSYLDYSLVSKDKRRFLGAFK